MGGVKLTKIMLEANMRNMIVEKESYERRLESFRVAMSERALEILDLRAKLASREIIVQGLNKDILIQRDTIHEAVRDNYRLNQVIIALEMDRFGIERPKKNVTGLDALFG